MLHICLKLQVIALLFLRKNDLYTGGEAFDHKEPVDLDWRCGQRQRLSGTRQAGFHPLGRG